MLNKICSALAGIVLLAMMASGSAHAQFLGHNITGDYGLQSATQPPPGTYLSLLYLGYEADSLRDSDGNEIELGPGERGDLDVNGYGVGLWYVSEHKILGGNYSFMVAPAWTDNKLRAPILGLAQKTDTGLTDLYVQPINLGWTTDRVDYMAGIGVFAPTGDFEMGADDNLGLGFWSLELFGGFTYYFDDARTWHFAATAFYETHTEQEDTGITVGDIITVEGGLGKSFMEGSINVGVAYYGQWKVSDDDLGRDFEPPLEFNFIGRNRGFGIGPEVNIPLATRKTLYGFFNLRYFWESGNRSTVQGETLVATFTFPIPSVAL